MPPSNVLLATDLDCRTDRALDRAAALASEWGTRLVIVHAIEDTPEPIGRPRPTDPRAVAMQRIRADLREPNDLDIELVVEHGDAARLTLDTVERLGCELVVTGVARNAPLGRVSAGATVDALARRSPVPLLAVKTRPTRSYQNMVVATDFSDASRDALVAALAMFPTSLVVLVHAYSVLYESFTVDRAAARAQEAHHVEERARLFLAGAPIDHDREILIRCEHGTPDEVLRDLVLAGGVDLVVTGTRGRGRVAQFLLGSVAKAVLADVPCDVLVVGERAA